MELQTGPNDHNRRIDRILRKALPEYPLSMLHRLLRQGKILVNHKRAVPKDRVPSGSVITVTEIGTKDREQGTGDKGQETKAQKLIPNSSLPRNPIPHTPYPSLDILYQDSDLLILNKPVGITVHGPESLDTLVQTYLSAQKTEKKSISFKPGPLHRLDKPTSGIIPFL